MAKLVIVEDDSLVAMGMRFYLESRGHEVLTVATTGEQAVSAAVAMFPELVLMDVRLNGELDGVETAKRIHSLTGIPIVFLSGSNDAQTLARMRALGPAGILLKPVVPAELAAEVERYAVPVAAQ